MTNTKLGFRAWDRAPEEEGAHKLSFVSHSAICFALTQEFLSRNNVGE